MNRRQKKKKDKEAIKLAKKIMFFSIEADNKRCQISYWDYKSKVKRKDMKYRPNRKLTLHNIKYGYKSHHDAQSEFKDELEAKEMLLKVCRKCLQDGFPLEEYCLWEIPYGDKRGHIICFVHIKDYEEHHDFKKDIKIREIDFWCPYNSRMAIPQGLDNNSNQYDCETCFEAVYDD